MSHGREHGERNAVFRLAVLPGLVVGPGYPSSVAEPRGKVAVSRVALSGDAGLSDAGAPADARAGVCALGAPFQPPPRRQAG